MDLNQKKEHIHQQIQKLFHKKKAILVKRGNDAIQQSLKLAYKLGKKKLLICDQGGWMSYPKYGKQIGFEIYTLKTDNGLLSLEELRNHVDASSVLLIHSLAGYIVHQNMALIERTCAKRNCFLINDATGSVGTAPSQFGDIIFASFGKDKPLKMGKKAGFVCFNNEGYGKELQEHNFEEKELEQIHNALKNLQQRLHFLQQRRVEILKHFQSKALFSNKYGLNVVVPFASEKEKKNIITYCENNNLEYTTCPREIRVLQNAISIEVKRL